MIGKSLKFKFLISILVTTTIALLVSCGAMVIFNLHDYSEIVTKELIAQTAILGRAITPALQFNDPTSAEIYLQLLEHRPDIVEAAVYDARGELFASYRTQEGQIEPLANVPKIDGSWVEGESLVVYQKVAFENQIQGFVFLRMQYDLVDKLLGNLAIALGSILIAVLIVFLSSLYLHKIVIGPISSLSSLARRLTGSKDYSLRASKSSHDEIGYLTDAFNDMLDEVVAGRRNMEIANDELKLEIKERMDAEIALKISEENVLKLNAELEQRVKTRTQQLELANEELESFSYSVSHDLRAPLRAIDGFSQALAEDYSELLDTRGKDYLRRVRTAAQKMGGLIDDMLKLARVSRADMNFELVDLSAMVEELIGELKGQDTNRDVTVNITSGLSALCDPHLMRVALTNLINNSWKYTSKIPSANIEFGLRFCNSEPAFFIEDNGAGFDMAYAGKLFGAFQRMHSEDEFSGSGVGLATVKRVISRHGGQVWAEAEVGEGATFYFTLPPQEFALSQTGEKI